MAEYLADQVRVGVAEPDPHAPPDRLVRSTDPALALRKAFPDIWIREDGAFRCERTGVVWFPGDVENDAEDFGRVPRGGVCGFSGSLSGSPTKLKLSQLWALTDYIEAVSAPPPQGEEKP